MEPIISFKNYTFQYRAQSEPTLHDINLDIYPGEKVLIAGASGSGKSTLANCINGLVPFSYAGNVAGELFVGGKNTKDLSIFELSKTVGTVLQDTDGQFIGLTVGEDIAFALENDCVDTNDMKATVHRAAALVNVDKLLDRAPNELSGGQKQRVSLAGILVDEVKVLLFDEPLANIDPATGKHTIALIDSIARHTSSAVIIIEHRIEDVLYRDVDRIVLMDEGRIVADMKPDEMLCTDLLPQHGLREPLYISALKYAGVELTPEKHPQHFDTLALSMNDKIRVSKWFHDENTVSGIKKQEPLLEIKDISFAYREGEPALTDVSFALNKGEMVSIAGQNGAGKSTLAKLICGFLSPDKGDIRLNGASVLNMNIRARAEKIGYVMQNPNQMISQAMIFDELALGLRKQGLTESEIIERTDDTLKICGLYPFRKWPVSALSYGQKKRVTIASVLALNPSVLILDEPTAGQDYRHYTEIMEFLRTLNDDGVTVIMITHDMHLMLEYTSRSLVFANGTLIADKTPAEVLCNAELVKRASLKETSLFGLANVCYINPPEDLCARFIREERQVRGHGE